MYENNKDIGWKKKENNNSSNGSYDDSLIKNQINVLDKKIEDKQDELISGSNIKTINGQSILGNGNITIKEGENVDLSEYAAKEELNNKADKSDIPTKVSQLTNDKNYLTSIPSEYVTETELNQKGYITQHQDISYLATKDELNNKADVDIVPTKVSDLENDSNFVASNTILRIEIVSELPEVEEDGVLYIVK